MASGELELMAGLTFVEKKRLERVLGTIGKVSPRYWKREETFMMGNTARVVTTIAVSSSSREELG